MPYGSTLRCAVAAETAQLYVRGFDAGGLGRSNSPSKKASNATQSFPASAGCPWTAFPTRCASRRGTASCFRAGGPFRLASDLTLAPVDAGPIFSPRGMAASSRINGGGDFFVVGGRFAFSGNHAGILLGVLPPIVHIRKESDKAALRWSV